KKFKNFKSGNVYVMEFWATWCGPCLAGMPHLTEVQEKYKDKGLTIIGVSREEPAKVENFLAKDEWDKKTGYTIALDESSKTNNAYMKAAGQNGIPTAFIVGKDGRVEWIGHPMSMDEPLAKVIDGSWNRKEFRDEFEKAEARARAERKLRQELMSAQRSGDFDKALELMDAAIAKNPGNLSMEVQRFQMMVGPMNNPDGYEYGWKMLKENRNNPSLLNAIAWFTLDDDSVKDRDLEFAMAAAKAANEASAGTDSAILDTLARAYFEAGDMDRAIKFQRKAVDKCDNEQMLGDLEATLNSYEKAAKSNSA
ncbi:MAG: TlpA family protein disulfide reductase, partial [Phycisphaerales bacterium]|nr:TlpA family protein disulfide reductase [Phycisphaerales bacterium]